VSASTDWTEAVALLRSTGVEIQDGLTDAEVDSVEARLQIRFPPDLRAFLATGLPVGKGFPDWRSESDDSLRTRLEAPVDGVLWDVEHNAAWLADWGERPEPTEDALRVARERLEQAPALVPVYSHRYIAAEPPEAGNPVLSVHQSDIIVYGPDLATYLQAEFASSGAAKSDMRPRHIAVWSDLML
jgi:hypothetical protein